MPYLLCHPLGWGSSVVVVTARLPLTVSCMTSVLVTPAVEQTWPEAVRSALLRGHSLSAIEGALVRRFLSDASLVVEKNVLLLDVTRPSEEVLAASSVLSCPGALSLDDLVRAFELLVPSDDAKLYGAVFTPSGITSFMAQETITSTVAAQGPHVVDPACGCGALLVAALRRVHDLTGEAPSSVVPRLHGVDVSAESLHRARVLLAITALALGEDVPQLEYSLLAGNSLTLDWKSAFPGVAGRFDVVLGNPPYVRYQHLPEPLRRTLAASWSTLRSGSPNLYFAFFELAKRILETDGVVCFITPNNFFATKSAAPLRSWLTSEGGLTRIVDFGHTRVFDALTYTTITFMVQDTTPEDTVEYALVDSVAALQGLSSEDFLESPAESLSGAPWQLVGRGDDVAIKRIMSTGRPLLSVADVRYGIKTCRDRVYLVKGVPDEKGFLTKEYLGRSFRIEEAVTVPHAVVPDLAEEGDVTSSTQRIVYPYTVVDGRAVVIPEEVLKEKFPMCYAYLLAVRPELGARDKGKKSYATWYAYARTQAIVPVTDKLLTPEYAARPRLMRDPRPGALFSNGCSVAPLASPEVGPAVSMEFLQAVLSSGVFHYFMDKTSTVIDGGYRSYQKSRLAPFGVVDLSPTEQAKVLASSSRGADLLLAAHYGISLPSEYLRP